MASEPQWVEHLFEDVPASTGLAATLYWPIQMGVVRFACPSIVGATYQIRGNYVWLDNVWPSSFHLLCSSGYATGKQNLRVKIIALSKPSVE